MGGEGERWKGHFPGERLFSRVDGRPDRFAEAYRQGRNNRPRAGPPPGDIYTRAGGRTAISVGEAITTAHRIEIQGANHRSLLAFTDAITVGRSFGTVAEGIAVAVGSTAHLGQVFTGAHMVDGDPRGSGHAGIGVGLSIAAAYAVQFPGAETGNRDTFANPITLTDVLVAVADGIAVAIGFAAIGRRLITAFADIVNADAVGGGKAGVRVGLSITAADRFEYARTGLRPLSTFPGFIAEALFTAAIGSPWAVSVAVTSLRRLIFACADMVDAGPARGGDTGV